MKKIKKILIANRGEIACRVMKTARQMGIKTVAVYSDADAKALHTRMADESVHIGNSPAAESYLVIDKIIDACKQTGADAVHPGYGFLSENPKFARRLQKEKITFIGPAPESMEAMGLKDAAKTLMDDAGVPITPGYHGKDQDPKVLEAKAGMIGYPVLIKAVAGGGGKGMRKVEAAKDFQDMLASCQREAKSSFGNDDVLIEKYIQSPRHIEVQVFGDTHGNVVHMFERDCSLQRRHQKVIEEAPAPGMTYAVRKAMTDAAVQAAKAVNYVGAGTVEFIVDGSGKLRTDGFWFMEMNTRLQVEHPVTEMITGLDLVELQIRVAQGEKLPKQKDIKMDGHAIEARLYAEDPANDFLPSIGALEYFMLPQSSLQRVDTGFMQGDLISLYYDPMIAKQIHKGDTRINAIDGLLADIRNSKIWPLKTNQAFLKNTLKNKDFRKSKIDTSFIPHHLNKLIERERTRSEILTIAASTYFWFDRETANKVKSPWTTYDNWRLNHKSAMSKLLSINNEVEHVEIRFDENTDKLEVTTSSKTHSMEYGFLEGQKFWDKEFNFYLDADIWVTGYLHEKENRLIIFLSGETYEVDRVFGYEGIDKTIAGDSVTSPMPGKIIAVNVKPGDTVKAGDPVIVMEAMKMEMTLEAPRDGIVEAVAAELDALVSDGEVLLKLEKEEK